MAIDKLIDSSNLNGIFTSIANSIRNKNGSTDTYKPSEMASAIDGIEIGSSGYDDEIVKSLIDRSVTNITLPSGITSIGDSAFESCSNLSLTELPSGITSIGNDAFYGCSNLSLTELPSSITSIKKYTFSFCGNLTTMELPSGIISIEDKAFYYCSNLKSVIFKGTPESISSSVFDSCTKLTSIYVPWSEGAVANAPWGATNATIYYNSQI